MQIDYIGPHIHQIMTEELFFSPAKHLCYEVPVLVIILELSFLLVTTADYMKCSVFTGYLLVPYNLMSLD